jgi:hypothetical protein
LISLAKFRSNSDTHLVQVSLDLATEYFRMDLKEDAGIILTGLKKIVEDGLVDERVGVEWFAKMGMWWSGIGESERG